MKLFAPNRLIKSPPAWPIVGHAPYFVRDKLGFLRSCQETYGDTVRVKIGRPVWLLNSPDDIEYVLAKNANNYEKTPKLTSTRGRRLSGHGLHTATGRDRLPKRRLIQPLFHHSIIASFSDSIASITDNMLDSWCVGDEIDLFDAMMQLTQKVTIRVLLGESFGDHNGKFAAALTTRRQYIEYFFTSILPYAEYLPVPVVWKFRKARSHLHMVLDREIRQRRKAATVSYDLLSMLITTSDRDGKPMNDIQVRDEAVTITSTGYETIGAALSWTLHLLSQHEQEQRRVLAEVRSIKSLEGTLFDHIKQMEYTRMVFNESLRLYPPTWIFIRVANKDDQLPSGTSIRRGDEIYLCPNTMHHLKRYYTDPDRFDPDRFSKDAIKNRPRFSFYPFGGGSRLCIGEPLARLEAMIIISRVVQRFGFEPVGTNRIVPRPSIVLEPRGGLPMRLTEPLSM